MTDLYAVLEANFGHTAFRSSQEEIVRRVLEGQDTLGVLPTGAGKSLCYQLPSLLLPRPTLVVSPLIALMQDQMDGLPPALYPKATLINSSLDREEMDRRLVGIEVGLYSLIYAAPERLRQPGFLELLERVGLSLVVVDEAHCVSVWGPDFRPDYLFIRKALERIGANGTPPTLLALTATATPEMKLEIAAQLGRSLAVVNAPMFRPNLRMEAISCPNADAKMKRLGMLCRETQGAAIVYAGSRERCEQLATFLNRRNIPTAFYHAGLEAEERRQTQERFMLGKVRVMVATVAFGMGVDKANVRLVVHFTLPDSVEAYAQEAGRAGRDGKPARCVLLFSASDKASRSRWLKQEEVKLETVRDIYRTLKGWLGKGAGVVSGDDLRVALNGTDDAGFETKLRVGVSMLERVGLLARHPDNGRDLRIEMRPVSPESRTELDTLLLSRREHAESRLEAMLAYAQSKTCRHARLSAHFGQFLEPCGTACDVCLGNVEGTPEKAVAPTAAEVPDVGRVLLEAIASFAFTMGRTGIAKVVVGAADSPVPKERCPQFGLLEGFSRKAVMVFLDTLIQEGLLFQDNSGEFPSVTLTTAGRTALQTDTTILANPNRAERTVRRASSLAAGGETERTAAVSEDEDDVFERLRAWRRIEAERQKLPPYVIFHDATLRAIARAFPATLTDFQTITGIGPRKLEIYSETILALLHGEPQTGEGETE